MIIIDIDEKERKYITIDQLYKDILSFYSNNTKNTKNYVLYHYWSKNEAICTLIKKYKDK